jgi:hypothetical protein
MIRTGIDAGARTMQENKLCHSRAGGNPERIEKHWIPGQARNDGQFHA